MSSDSDNSDADGVSRFSVASYATNESMQHNQSLQNESISKLADDMEESMIITRKKQTRKPIWDSDSSSEAETNANDSLDSDSDSENESKSKSKVVNKSDDDDSDSEPVRSKATKCLKNVNKTMKKKLNKYDSDSENESSDDEIKTTFSSDGEKSKSDSEYRESDDDDEKSVQDDTDVMEISKKDSTKEIQSDDSNVSKQKSYNSQNESKLSGRRLDYDENESSQQDTMNSPSVFVPETDDEDEHELSEIHVFSPRTRRSITGRRSIGDHRRSILPKLNSENDTDESDDDEILTNEKDETSQVDSSYKSAEEASKEFSTDENDVEEHFKRNRSYAPNESEFAIKTPHAKRFSHHGISTSAITSSTPSRSTPDIEFSDKSVEIHGNSIQINSSNSENEMKSIQNESSVVFLNSSDEENHKPFSNSTQIDIKSSTPGALKLVQPKLQFGRLTAPKKFVSRKFYQDQIDNLTVQKKELKDNEDLLARLGPTLPDKGRNLQQRVDNLKRDMKKKEAELDMYAIEEDNMDDVMVVTTINQPKNVVNNNWRDELDTIQPRFTGQQGMSTFNTQRTLTLNRIEKLHKAMEKCPGEMELASQPENLNVQLMPHQLHAIKWMRWRETQRPKGGILADDMGLGKTLTVIGLVLDTKYRKVQDVEEEDKDENTEDEEESDDDNERGYKKKYPNSGGTLIICPASLINQWEKEIENRVKRRKLTVLMHHGNKRKESIHSICKYDLVITTYGIISSDHKSNSALFRIHWNRVVLDEAHMIRNHTTAVAKGCSDLRSTMRWGLTGTPIQNKHMDVYSMFKFLRVTPFDDLPTYKKWIDPKTQAGMSRLHNILKPLLLRRTKAELQSKGELRALPSKTIQIEDVELSPDEANIYTKILAYSQGLFAQFMEQHQQRTGGGRLQLPSDVQRRLELVRRFGRGQDDIKSSQILVLLLRLRQICDHPGLINQMLIDECDLDDDAEEEFDSVDMNIVKEMIGLKINDSNGNHNSSGNENELNGNNVLLSTNKLYDFKTPSSKCKRTIEIVKRILRETDDKIVIVSQWTSFLNIVSDFLNRERVHYVELTGKTPIKERNNIVVSFNNPNTSERVLMLSLVAGGVGLNLTGANHLILLDPHWNPQLESQAFDRVYRVGQTKDVIIYKLLCVKTVEKHIQTIQDNKLQLSNNVLTGSKQGSGTKLSIQDMRQLFDL